MLFFNDDDDDGESGYTRSVGDDASEPEDEDGNVAGLDAMDGEGAE